MTRRAVSRQLENQLDIALTAARLGIWEWDIDAGRVAWSEQIETMHGMEPGAFTGDFEAFAATIHPADRESVLLDIQRTLETGRDLHNHYRFVRRDGSYGWLRGIGRVLYNDEGRPVRVIGVAMDVTDDTEADLRLRAAYAERDAVARTLQAGLLAPTLPKVPGLDIAAAYQPGRGEIGGDFYDLFALGNGQWALTIGDVCGKGHKAAALTALVRHAMRTAALLDEDPAAVMRATNRAHLSAETGERFSTTHYLRIEPAGDQVRIRLGSSGHPPVLVLRADGTSERFAGKGMVLGVLYDATFEAVDFTLGADDLLIAYTDGVTEARAAGGAMFDTEGIIAALADRADSAPQAVVDTLMAAVADHAGGRLTDDIAVVVGRRSM